MWIHANPGSKLADAPIGKSLLENGSLDQTNIVQFADFHPGIAERYPVFHRHAFELTATVSQIRPVDFKSVSLAPFREMGIQGALEFRFQILPLLFCDNHRAKCKDRLLRIVQVQPGVSRLIKVNEMHGLSSYAFATRGKICRRLPQMLAARNGQHGSHGATSGPRFTKAGIFSAFSWLDGKVTTMPRHSFAILSALSLLLCVGTSALWVRSYFACDRFFVQRLLPMPRICEGWALFSNRGVFQYEWQAGNLSVGRHAAYKALPAAPWNFPPSTWCNRRGFYYESETDVVTPRGFYSYRQLNFP